LGRLFDQVARTNLGAARSTRWSFDIADAVVRERAARAGMLG
jgi:hypothetical protein